LLTSQIECGATIMAARVSERMCACYQPMGHAHATDPQRVRHQDEFEAEEPSPSALTQRTEDEAPKRRMQDEEAAAEILPTAPKQTHARSNAPPSFQRSGVRGGPPSPTNQLTGQPRAHPSHRLSQRTIHSSSRDAEWPTPASTQRRRGEQPVLTKLRLDALSSPIRKTARIRTSNETDLPQSPDASHRNPGDVATMRAPKINKLRLDELSTPFHRTARCTVQSSERQPAQATSERQPALASWLATRQSAPGQGASAQQPSRQPSERQSPPSRSLNVATTWGSPPGASRPGTLAVAATDRGPRRARAQPADRRKQLEAHNEAYGPHAQAAAQPAQPTPTDARQALELAFDRTSFNRAAFMRAANG